MNITTKYEIFKVLRGKNYSRTLVLTPTSSYNETFYLWVSSKSGGWPYILRKTFINHVWATYHTTHPSCCHATTDVQCLPVDVNPLFFELKGPQGGDWGGGRPWSRPLAFTFPAGFQSRPQQKLPHGFPKPLFHKSFLRFPEAAYSAVALQKARNTLPQILEKSSPLCYSIKKRFHPPASKQAR